MRMEEYLLVCLIEELNEAAQRATKALRFGLSEVQPGQDLNNVERLRGELLDCAAVILMMQDAGMITIPKFDADALKKKWAKIKLYAEYSYQLGVIDNL